MKKKLLAALLAVCMVASMLMPAAAATTSFNDVEEDAWYAGSIERWAGYGILNGVGDNSFNPEGDMTRAQFAKMVVELLGLPVDEDAECPFEDLAGTDDEWAIPYIVAAYKAGIINGASATQFNPNDGRTVSFEQASAILARALGLVEPTAYGDKVTEKLTELGMLDEQVNADADMNRALVAALADNMIGVYVTPETVDEVTEDGVITGEVKNGVILVVGSDAGVAVEIKDVNVPAIVMNGGNVTLTGETTVDTVKVGGGNATVVAEEGTTVGAVSVEGTNANLSLDGEVESVTVTEDATVSNLEGAGVNADNVVNNTSEAIEVNGEAVEPTEPAEPETPDEGDDEPETPDETTDEGFVPTYNPDQPTIPAVADDAVFTQEVVAEDEEARELCTDGHTVGSAKVTKPATCKEAGSATYTCTKCGGTTTVEIAKLTTHTAVMDVPAVPATCVAAGRAAGQACYVCSSKDEETGEWTYVWCTGTGVETSAPKALPALGHSYKISATDEKTGNATEWTCTRCDENTAEHTVKVCPNTKNHASLDKDEPCPMGCGEVGAGTAVVTHTHTWADTWVTTDATNHWHICTDTTCSLNKTAPSKEETANGKSNGFGAHTWGTGAADGTITCTTCKATKQCANKDNHETLPKGTTCSCGYEGTYVESAGPRG